jgi:OmpR-family two-component system manganese-sensing response regulator
MVKRSKFFEEKEGQRAARRALHCRLVHNAKDATAYVHSVTYDLLILDWELPDGTGLDICLEYRRAKGTGGVLFLTGRSHINDKLTGLESGADDYLTKPFDMRELLSRVRAILRRPPVVGYKTITVRDIELDPVEHSVKMAGSELKLYPKEFSLLQLFMLHPKQVFSPDDLLNRVISGTSVSRSTFCRKRNIKRLPVFSFFFFRVVHLIVEKRSRNLCTQLFRNIRVFVEAPTFAISEEKSSKGADFMVSTEA